MIMFTECLFLFSSHALRGDVNLRMKRNINEMRFVEKSRYEFYKFRALRCDRM